MVVNQTTFSDDRKVIQPTFKICTVLQAMIRRRLTDTMSNKAVHKNTGRTHTSINKRGEVHVSLLKYVLRYPRMVPSLKSEQEENIATKSTKKAILQTSYWIYNGKIELKMLGMTKSI